MAQECLEVDLDTESHHPSDSSDTEDKETYGKGICDKELKQSGFALLTVFLQKKQMSYATEYN